MADIRQTLVLEVRGGQAVLTLADNVEAVGKAVPPVTDKIAQMSTTTGKFAQAVDMTSASLARSADAFGLPAAPIRALNDVAEVAALGFTNLSTTAVGFNAATLGVATAAGAAGFAIGTLAREHIPGLKEAADDAAAALVRLFTAQSDLDAQANAMKGLDKFQKDMAASAAKAEQTRLEGMRAAGMKTAEIIDFLDGKRETSSEKLIDKLKQEEAAHKKAVEVAKRSAEDQATAILKAQKAHEDYKDALLDVTLIQIKYQETIGDAAAAKQASNNAERMLETIEAQKQAYEDSVQAQIEDGERLEKFREAQAQAEEERQQRTIDSLHSLGDAFLTAGDLMVAMGASADNVFLKMADGFAGVAHAAGGFLQAMATGNIFDKIGAGIGLIGSAFGAVKNIFGGGEGAKVNDMRDAFLETHGGFVMLQTKLAEFTDQDLVKKIFNADTVTEFNAAVGEAMAVLDMGKVSQEALNEAVDRYGFTIDELGPKWRQQELDKMAGQLLQDYKLLTASGIDVSLVNEKMAGSMNEYVQTAIAAGSSVPEAMRPQIEQMIEMGLLTDEQGNAYASAEEAGITFAQSMSEQFTTLIDKIDQMVSALMGIPNVQRTVTIDTVHTGGGAPAGGGGGGTGGGGGGKHQESSGMGLSSTGGGGGSGQLYVGVVLDGKEIGHAITKMSQTGEVRINPKALTGAGF